jgi:hypothetical protein
MGESQKEGSREQGVDHEHQQQDGTRGSRGVLALSTSTAMSLVHLAAEEDPALLLEHPPGRETEAEMVIATGTGTGIGIGIEKGIETKTGIGTKTHVVDEMIIGILIDISGKVGTMGLMRGKRFPNRAEGAHAVVAVAAAAAAAEAAGGREAKIGIMRKVVRAAGVPVLSGSMRAVEGSEVEAEVAIGMKDREDIEAGLATVAVTVTENENENEIETGIVIVIVIVIVTENAIETVRGIGIAGESRMSRLGLGAEVGSQRGSLLVGTRALSKHCIMAHMGVGYGAIPFMRNIDHYIHIVRV